MWTTAAMAGDPQGARKSRSTGLVGKLASRNDNGLVIGKTNGPFTVGGLPRLNACAKAPIFLPQATQRYLWSGQYPQAQHQGYSTLTQQQLQQMQYLQQLQHMQQLQQLQQVQYLPASQSAVHHHSAVMPQTPMAYGSHMVSAMPAQIAYMQQPQQVGGLIRSSSIATPSSLGLATGYTGAFSTPPALPWSSQMIGAQSMTLPTTAMSTFGQPGGYSLGYY